MASLGHVAVGMAAARQYEERVRHWPSLALWSALSLLPDVDVIGFPLGVQYGDPWGHRGATHSFAFALVVGSAIGLVAARRWNRPTVRTALFACAVLASHPLLDSMTDGGLGCAFFWPIDLTRYFAPWRPIQVAPIGPDFLSLEGAIIALSELVLFFPLLVFALRSPGSRARPVGRGITVALWLVAAWLIASSDPIREATVASILHDRTVFASGFSEPSFATISVGEDQSQVGKTLGTPLEVSWHYPPQGSPACAAVSLEDDVVSESFPPEECESRGIWTGASKEAVERQLGAPSESCWAYSRGVPGRAFRLRLVCFTGTKVAMVARRWMVLPAEK